MTIHEVIQRIQNLYSKGTPSDDSRLSQRHIYNKLKTVRSRLITQELNRRRVTSAWLYQTIPCVELVETDNYECSCLPSIGCKVLRSKHKIPKPLVGYSKSFISSVTSIEGSIKYSQTDKATNTYSKGNKYTKDNPTYYIQNEYLYTTFTKGPRVISITGVFEDPLEVNKFPSRCNENSSSNRDECTSPLDAEFPVENDMLDQIIELCFNELIQLFSNMPEDKSNNSTDSPIENSK